MPQYVRDVLLAEGALQDGNVQDASTRIARWYGPHTRPLRLRIEQLAHSVEKSGVGARGPSVRAGD